MYEQQFREDILFCMFYASVAVMAIIASCYLLFRRGNAFAPNITPPARLRRWTSALFAAIAFSHVWYLPILYCTSVDDVRQGYLVGGLLDSMTIYPLAIVVLLTMLQDRQRPLWPVGLMAAPLVAGMVLCVVKGTDALWPALSIYLLVSGIGFIIYMVRALKQYGHWLRDNYADLEHKEVWQTFVVLAVILLLFGIYTSSIAGPVYNYIVQMVEMAVVGYLLWRVETLSDLSAQQSKEQVLDCSLPRSNQKTCPPDIETTAIHDEITPLLQEYCVDAQLYLEHDLTLQQLAKAIGINRYYLSQYFSGQGTTYNTYINGLRINHFINLYREAVANGSSFTTKQLVHNSGYRSYSTFSLAFKQRMGQNVTAWIRKSEGSVKLLMLVVCLGISGQMMAQEGVVSLAKKGKAMLDSMSVRGVDRRYIEAPARPWQLLIKGNVSQTIVNMDSWGDAYYEEYTANAKLKTEHWLRRSCIRDLQPRTLLLQCFRTIQQHPLSSQRHPRLSE